jgi:hypothetical protein
MYPYSHEHLADELRTAIEEVIKDPRSHTFWKARSLLEQMEGTPEEQRARAIRAYMKDPSAKNLSESQNQVENHAARLRAPFTQKLERIKKGA